MQLFKMCKYKGFINCVEIQTIYSNTNYFHTFEVYKNIKEY